MRQAGDAPVPAPSSRTRRLARPAAVTAAIAVGLSASFALVVHAADPRLDEADQALQKASALLEASQSGVTSPAVQKKFERHVGRAGELIDRARQHVQAAREAVDAEIGSAAGSNSPEDADAATP